MTTKRCACCGRPFEPRPQVPDQAFCPSRECQRARKRQWQRDKLKSDPDYRVNQRAAQEAWAQRNQDYWRNYRAAHPEYEDGNRNRQRLRDADGSDVDLAKMDACDLPTGLYRIAWHPASPMRHGTSLVVEITPICASWPSLLKRWLTQAQ